MSIFSRKGCVDIMPFPPKQVKLYMLGTLCVYLHDVNTSSNHNYVRVYLHAGFLDTYIQSKIISTYACTKANDLIHRSRMYLQLLRSFFVMSTTSSRLIGRCLRLPKALCSCTHSLLPNLTHSRTHSLTQSINRLPTRSLIQSPTDALTHPLKH